MRIALLGAGTIAGLVLRHLRRGDLPGIEVIGISGRSAASRGATLAAEHALPYVIGGQALLALGPQVVVEAASHDAVREHLVPFLDAGVERSMSITYSVSDAMSQATLAPTVQSAVIFSVAARSQ
jgi:predicted dinucleotide-utilizing enzyme